MVNIKIFDVSSEELYELINEVKTNLLNTNSEYKKCKDEVFEIVKQYPNIDKIYDTKSSLELTKEECEMLQKMMDLELKISEYEQHEILFLGGRIAHNYFKKIGLFKE